MARKPSKPAPQNIDDEIPTGHAISVQEVSDLHQLQAGYTAERDLMNQLLGRVQLMKGFSKITDVMALSDMRRIKDSKLYRVLSGTTVTDHRGLEIADVGTWAGFCAAMGMSVSKADEDLSNLDLFGEDALQSMNRVGLGYRELRKLRKLPETDRLAIIHEVEIDTGDKDAIINLIDDMAAKHAGEKQALQAQVKDLTADLDAQRQINETKNAKIDRLTADLHKRDNIPVDERGNDLSTRLNDATLATLGALLALEVVLREATEWEDRPSHITNQRPQCCNRVRTRLDDIQTAYGAWEDLSHDPAEDAWINEVNSQSLAS